MKEILAIILINGLFLAAYGQVPTFENAGYVYDGASPIDVGFYGSPFTYDWNGDGKKDFIVGQFTNGNIRYYENIGDHDDPSFNGFSYLQANGTTITLPYG